MQHKVDLGEAKSKPSLDSYLHENIFMLNEKEEFDILK